jgi:hypothetical protein
MRFPKSKRFRFSLVVIAVNFLLGGMGMYLKADLVQLGTFLVMSNSPLYVYILGESYRPSNLKNTEQ